MSMLTEITDYLAAHFDLYPVMGAEIECYVLLPDESTEVVESFWKQVDKAFRHEGLPILRIEKERGWNQYEVITTTMPAHELVFTLNAIRDTLEKYARRNSVQVLFDAKPFSDQPSSGLHLHLHLADATGANAYHKTPEWMSESLRHSLGGLLATLHTAMPIYFPRAEDYARLEDPDHVPKLYGWGVNNRYCALRLPANADPYNKRIENRVPCANADPEQAIEAMLGGVLTGLIDKIEPPAQEHGKMGIGLLESYAAASYGNAVMPAPAEVAQPVEAGLKADAFSFAANEVEISAEQIPSHRQEEAA